MKTYLIDYIVYGNGNIVIKQGVMRAKNRYSELDAKIKLEVFLKKKYPAFNRLVIASCVEDKPINDIFKDIFGKNSPFGL